MADEYVQPIMTDEQRALFESWYADSAIYEGKDERGYGLWLGGRCLVRELRAALIAERDFSSKMADELRVARAKANLWQGATIECAKVRVDDLEEQFVQSEAVSVGRLAALIEKSNEAKREWIRAEMAEGLLSLTRKALLWYAKHLNHVTDLLATPGPAFEPSGSDVHRPYLWKSGHWKWLMSL